MPTALPCPPEARIYTLDGEKHTGISAFLDHMLSKDVRITPEQAEIELKQAKDLGFENVHEAIGSVNKRMGKGKVAEQKGIAETKPVETVQEQKLNEDEFIRQADNILPSNMKKVRDAGWNPITGKKEGSKFELTKLYLSQLSSDKFKSKLEELENRFKQSQPTNPIEDIQGEQGKSKPPYTRFADIPPEELKAASRERKAEQFDTKVDNAAKKLIERFSAKLPEGTQKSGVGLPELITGAAEIIKKAYHAGQDLKQAVKEALDHIKAKWDKAWGAYDEAEVADALYESGAFTIDEEIEMRFGLTPQEVLNIWNSSDAGRSNPELLDFIQSLSDSEKKKIVKEAMKGIVSPELDKFIKVVKQKTGNVIEMMSKDEFKKTVDEKIHEELLKEEAKRKVTEEQVKEALKNAKTDKSFMQTIKETKMAEWSEDLVKGIGLAFHPAMFEGKEFARDAMSIIRKEKSREAAINEKADKASKKMIFAWTQVPKVTKIAFMLSIENKAKYGDAYPQYKAVADSYRQRMDAVFEQLSKIKDVNFLEDYFPHFWKKPDKARALFSKRPMEGDKSFLKKRFYADIMEGINAKLELATDNPEEIVRLAEMNAQRFETAHNILSDMKDNGLVKFYRNGQQPEGWELVNDPLFKRMALFTVKSEDATKLGEGNPEAAMSTGGWYMPEPAARVFNNYLSKGLSGSGRAGKAAYELIRGWNNTKNMFQLGIGGFHFVTTTNDALVTAFANANNKLIAGLAQRDPKLVFKALQEYGEYFTVLPSLARTIAAGRKILNKANKGYITAPEVQDFVDAGGRTGTSRLYMLDSHYNLLKAVGKLRYDWSEMGKMEATGQVAKAAFNAMMLPFEKIMHPLMQWWVPTLKAGGYFRTMQSELSIQKNLTPAEIQRVKERTIDDMDDRLGQMIYDNKFWNKSLKDIGFMTVRSLGWSGGTIMAYGKGIGEIPESGKRLLKGEGVSPRTMWMITLPMHVALMGATLQYIMTGKGPKELKDYFFPKDGTMNADGTEHRLVLPTYMKDLIAYGSDINSMFKNTDEKPHGAQTLKNKTAPFINEWLEIVGNKDFYGTQIWNPKDSYYQKGLEILEYEAQTFIPFSFKGYPGSKPTGTQQMLQKFGIMQASKEFQRNETQNHIMSEVAKEFGDEAKTEQDTIRFAARREIREMLFKNQEPSQELWDKADYTDKTRTQVEKDATLDPHKRMFRDLKSESQLNVWSTMSKQEKEDYTEYLNNKASFESLMENKKEIFDDPELQKAYDEILGLTHETRGRKGSGGPAL
jgi:hypothetical protein